MKSQLKTIKHSDNTIFGHHALIVHGIYRAVGFSFDSKAHALARATANLKRIMAGIEGTNAVDAFFKAINKKQS